MATNEPTLPIRRELDPDSPEAIKRERLLTIMRDRSRPEEERLDAAVAALPLCYERPAPVYVVTNGHPNRRQ